MVGVDFDCFVDLVFQASRGAGCDDAVAPAPDRSHRNADRHDVRRGDAAGDLVEIPTLQPKEPGDRGVEKAADDRTAERDDARHEVGAKARQLAGHDAAEAPADERDRPAALDRQRFEPRQEPFEGLGDLGAMAAERDSTDRYIAAYMSNRLGAEFVGKISGVTRFGLFVRLAETGADGLIPVRSLGREFFHHDERAHALVGEGTGTTFRLGDTVRVRLEEAAPLTGGLRFDLVEGGKAGSPMRARAPKRRFQRRDRRR